jgi:hypothetical protein
VTRGGGLSRAVVVAVAAAAAGASVGRLISTPVGFASIAWLAATVILYFVANAVAAKDETERAHGDVLEALRLASLASARDEQWRLSRLDTGILPGLNIDSATSAGAPAGVDRTEFLAMVQAGAPSCRWLVVGGFGLSESSLLHELAAALNENPEGPVAVVLPLASYDWTRASLEDWLAAEIVATFRVGDREVRRLITERKLFYLLDGLDTLPDAAGLEGGESSHRPVERPVLDQLAAWLGNRVGRGSPAHPRDPRRQLLRRLAGLGGFVLTTHDPGDVLTGDFDRDFLSIAWLAEFSSSEAQSRLTDRLPHLKGSHLPPSLSALVRNPLYLRLAINVCLEEELPPDESSRESVKAWLWTRYLTYQLATPDRVGLGWRAQAVLGWLDQCARAVGPKPVVASRLALLYPLFTRATLRGIRSVAVAGVVAGAAVLLQTSTTAWLLGLVALVFSAVTGEGTSSPVIVPQRFSFPRFVWVARKQLHYALLFTAAGGVVGLLAEKHRAFGDDLLIHASRGILVTTGAVAGLLLGVMMPTLYELYYATEPELHAARWRSSTVPGAVSGALRIGGLAGIIVSLAFYVAFQSATVLAVIPVCLASALLDILGLQLLAAAFWALSRRGPMRMRPLLTLADEVGLARGYGQYYFCDLAEIADIDAGAHSTETVAA